MIQVTDHIVEGSEMVCHFCAFKQRATYGNHRHSLLSKDARIIDGKRISLDGTRMRREQNLVIFHPLFLAHPVGYLLLILLSDALVFFYFIFKHRCKYTTFCEYKRIYKEKVVSLQR